MPLYGVSHSCVGSLLAAHILAMIHVSLGIRSQVGDTAVSGPEEVVVYDIGYGGEFGLQGPGGHRTRTMVMLSEGGV